MILTKKSQLIGNVVKQCCSQYGFYYKYHS